MQAFFKLALSGALIKVTTWSIISEYEKKCFLKDNIAQSISSFTAKKAGWEEHLTPLAETDRLKAAMHNKNFPAPDAAYIAECIGRDAPKNGAPALTITEVNKQGQLVLMVQRIILETYLFLLKRVANRFLQITKVEYIPDKLLGLHGEIYDNK